MATVDMTKPNRFDQVHIPTYALALQRNDLDGLAGVFAHQTTTAIRRRTR